MQQKKIILTKEDKSIIANKGALKGSINKYIQDPKLYEKAKERFYKEHNITKLMGI